MHIDICRFTLSELFFWRCAVYYTIPEILRSGWEEENWKEQGMAQYTYLPGAQGRSITTSR